MNDSSNAPARREFPAEGCAVIAGGSGGIGRAVVRALLEAGVDVALSYRNNLASAEAALAEINASGRRGLIAAASLETDGEAAAFVARARRELGPIHSVVYAAGPFIEMRHVSRIDPGLFRRTMEQDSFACFNLIHAALPHLRESRGSLVAVATPAMRRYAVKDLLSSAPKAAIEQLVKAVAAEEGRFGVRANAVGVGLLQDGMYDALVASGAFDATFLAAAERGIALRRLGTATEIADAIRFLASDRARWITGQTLMVDGGYAL